MEWLNKNKYLVKSVFFLLLSAIALVMRDAELLFCTFLICTSIWSAAHYLQKDFKTMTKTSVIVQNLEIKKGIGE